MTPTMRNLLMIVEQIERPHIEDVEVFGNSVRVWVNPNRALSSTLFNEFKVLRGTVDESDNLYVWDASVAIHQSVEDAMGIAVKDRMMLRSHQIAVEYDVNETDLRSIPSIARAYRNQEYDIINDKLLDDDDENYDW